MLFQPITPIIVQLSDAPTRETTVADVLLQAVGLTGAFIITAAVAGLIIGGILIWFKKLRPDNSINGQGSQGLGLYSPPHQT